MAPAGFGFTLQPDLEFLRLTRRIVEEYADFYELTPEAFWARDFRRTHQHGIVREIVARSGRPCVGHGVGYSVGAPERTERHDRWLAELRLEMRDFGFAWYSEHLGFTEHEGLQATLPLPLPPTREAVRAVAARMKELATLTPVVAFENNVAYVRAGDPLAEPEFFGAICAEAGCWLLLDLHNAYTQCLNFGVDLDRYLDRLDLARVLEIHVSGGSESEPGWLRSGRAYRLDTHDGPVPEPVWQALERLLPRCPGLRGVVLERLPLGLDAAKVVALEAECKRAKELLGC